MEESKFFVSRFCNYESFTFDRFCCITNGTTTIRSRAANLNSNLIIFAELEKRQLSSSSMIERVKFTDSNLLKRTLFLIFRYRLNDCKFAMPVPILHYFASLKLIYCIIIGVPSVFNEITVLQLRLQQLFVCY